MNDARLQGPEPGHHPRLHPRPGVGVLRDRLPADVPGALRRAARQPDPVEGRHARRSATSRSSTRCRRTQKAAFEETFDITRSDDLDAAIAEVKKGDADVAVEMQGDTLVAHYTQTDQVKAAVTQGVLQAFVDGTNVALSGKPPTYQLEAVRVEDDSLKTIQYVTPGLLGWAVAMSASFGAAATLNGWRNSKLLRRLQLSPVPTGTLVGARVAVTVGDRADPDGDLPRARRGVLRAEADRRLAGVDPAAGRRHALLHGDRAALRRGREDHRGRGQHGQLHRAADVVPERLVLPARRDAAVAADPRPRAAAVLAERGHARRDGARRVRRRRRCCRWRCWPAFAVVVTAAAAKLFRWETT